MADIYLLSEGRRDGPYTEVEIRPALAWGFIPRDLLAWKEGLIGGSFYIAKPVTADGLINAIEEHIHS